MTNTNKVIKARIKTWEEMKQLAVRFDEGYGIIYLPDNAYTKIMEDEMPKDRTIELLENPDFDGRYNTPDYEWVYTTDMIAEFIDESSEPSQVEKSLPEIYDNTENENQDQISEQIIPSVDVKKVIKSNLALVKDEMIRHVCHYLKFQLDFDEDVSIRFYYRFQDQQHLENNWVLVNHKTKQKGLLTRESAKMLIKSCCKIPAIEIIGRLNENGQYQKITTNKEGTIRTYEGRDK